MVYTKIKPLLQQKIKIYKNFCKTVIMQNLKKTGTSTETPEPLN